MFITDNLYSKIYNLLYGLYDYANRLPTTGLQPTANFL